MGWNQRKKKTFLLPVTSRGFTQTLTYKKYKLVCGFTLIEMLVVVAIIGLLATIGISAMAQARDKAYDAETIAQLSQARNAAQIFYDTYGSYKGEGGNVAFRCDANKSMFVDYNSGMYQYTIEENYSPDTSLRCSSNPNAYQISASLSTEGEYWCVNADGLSKKIYGYDHTNAHPNNDTDCTP